MNTPLMLAFAMTIGFALTRDSSSQSASLGPGIYLEILGPDPEQPKPARPRWLGIDDLMSPRLVGWATKGQALPQLAGNALRNGIQLGEVLSGSRQTPQGCRRFARRLAG